MRQNTRILAALVLGLAILWVPAPALAAPSTTTASAELLNVNKATNVELQALPGIGPKKAEAIIAFRTSHGPFLVVDDLVKVKGIGVKTLEKLRPLVTVGKVKPKKVRSHERVHGLL